MLFITDNPARDAENYFAWLDQRREAEEAERADAREFCRCAKCGRKIYLYSYYEGVPIPGDDHYILRGKEVCPECAEKYYGIERFCKEGSDD